jgi:predicted nucleic acid-binding protein
LAFARTESLHAPHLIDLEVLQSLRRYVRSRQLSSARGRIALEDFETLGIIRYSHGPLIARIWDLRDNFTAYDAAYLALAEELDAPLLTFDAKLSSAAGRHTRVRLI